MSSLQITDELPLSAQELEWDARLQGHMPALDGLRGAAILMVMFSHFIDLPYSPKLSLLDRLVGTQFSLGWLGVDLFFVLSGFLITGILFDSKSSSRYFRNFYARRTVRIFPLFYLFLVLKMVVSPHLPFLTESIRAQPIARQWSYWLYFFSLDRMFHFYPVTPLTVTWSLDIEEQFYLLWPLIIYFCSRRISIRLCIGLIIATLLARVITVLANGDVRMIYFCTPFRLDGLAVGSLIALVMRGKGGIESLTRVAKIAGPIFAACLIGSIAAIEWRHGIVQTDRWIGVTVLFFFSAMTFGCVLVWGVVSQPWFLRASPLRFFGRYSYALYLFHNTVKNGLDHKINPDKLPLIFRSHLPALFVYAMLCTGLAVCVALVTWNCFEKHFLKLKKYFPEPKRPIAVSN